MMGFWNWLKSGIPQAVFLIGMTGAFACSIFGLNLLLEGELITGIILEVLAFTSFFIGLYGLYKDMEV